MNFNRKCKTCGNNIYYKHKCSFILACKKDGDCKTCSALKRNPKSEETKKKISNTLTGRTVPRIVVEKIRNTIIEKFNTPEYKQKFSILHSGKNNGMFNKHHTEKTKQKISEITRQKMSTPEIKKKMFNIHNSIEYKTKLSNSLQGRVNSPDSRRKMREAIVRRVQKYGIHARGFNPKACKVIDDYGKQNGYNFKHALNGGEYSCFGYMVDGYDKDKNTVIEIDESRHFDKFGNLKEKDIIRQKEIENYLKCKFIRIPIDCHGNVKS